MSLIWPLATRSPREFHTAGRLFQFDHGVREEGHDRAVRRIRLPPAAESSRPTDGPKPPRHRIAGAVFGSSTTATPIPNPCPDAKIAKPNNVAPDRLLGLSRLEVIKARVSGCNNWLPFADLAPKNIRANNNSHPGSTKGLAPGDKRHVLGSLSDKAIHAAFAALAPKRRPVD